MDYGIDLFSYLTHVFEQLKRGCTDYESLCPWNEEILKKYGLKNKDLKEKGSDKEDWEQFSQPSRSFYIFEAPVKFGTLQLEDMKPTNDL